MTARRVIVLSVMAAGLSVTPTFAATCAPFEDGQMAGHPTRMAVPPQIITEGGRSFMRITASSSDRQAIPDDYEDRSRATVAYASGPVNTARVRFHASTRGIFFELFQRGGRTGGYGTKDGQGPVYICWVDGGRVGCRGNYVVGGQLKFHTVQLGSMRDGQFHTFTLRRNGGSELMVDGRVVHRVPAAHANLTSASHDAEFKLGMYGDDIAGGILDVDEVITGNGQGGCTGGEGPPPVSSPPPNPGPPREPPPSAPKPATAPEPLSRPTDLRMVMP